MLKTIYSLIIFVIILSSFSCGKATVKNSAAVNPDTSKNTVKTRFGLPEGYKRINPGENTFGEYLQNLKLKPEGTLVKNFDGSIKANKDVYVAVVDMDIGDKDLQQCADAVIRLRAEYLYAQNRFSDIHFYFTNGFWADYMKWRDGYIIIVKGLNAGWVKKSDEAVTYKDFRDYLNVVFTYAGTLSLSKELKSIYLSEIKIGDVFIKGGSPGHAVIIVDMAENEKGEKIFLLAQSYMPAQDIQILKNPMDTDLSPWYSTDFGEILETPEWEFNKAQLKSF